MTRGLFAAGVALLLAGGARADEVVLSSGKVLRGTVFPAQTETRVNPYRSTLAQMTWGVLTRPNAEVKETRPDDDAPALLAALEALATGDAAGRSALLVRAKRSGERAIARRIAEEVLRSKPDDAEALKTIGGAPAWTQRKRGDPLLDPALAREVRRVVRLESAADRRRETERLVKDQGLVLSPAWIERTARALLAPRGERHDVPLRLEAAANPGGTYSLFVPYELDALAARPLLLVIHGGSVPGEKATAVLGTGREALPLFVEGARAAGAIVVSPTAIEAPWGTPKNEAFLLAVLGEVAALWNVDLDRVFVAGEGSGAEGALWFASRQADRFAAVGVAAGLPSSLATSIAARGVGVWLYHGEKDDLIPVDDVRELADRLLSSGAGFAYCELPGQGHGFPPLAEGDWWRFALARRRPHPKSAWPRSSFSEPATKTEVETFGPPDASWGGDLPGTDEPDELLALLRRGTGAAEPAARRLAIARPEGLAGTAVKIATDRAVPVPGRVWAAWLCGELKDPSTAFPLGGVVRAEKDAVLLRRVAAALRAIGNEDAVEDLRSALQDATARWKKLSFPQDRIPFVEYERTCHLLADLAEALATVGHDAELAADIEAAAVIGVFRDSRPISRRADLGEDVSGPKARLAEACGRAYRALGAQPTLYDMLRVVLRGDPTALQAATRGAAEGLTRPTGPR